MYWNTTFLCPWRYGHGHRAYSSPSLYLNYAQISQILPLWASGPQTRWCCVALLHIGQTPCIPELWWLIPLYNLLMFGVDQPVTGPDILNISIKALYNVCDQHGLHWQRSESSWLLQQPGVQFHLDGLGLGSNDFADMRLWTMRQVAVVQSFECGRTEGGHHRPHDLYRLLRELLVVLLQTRKYVYMDLLYLQSALVGLIIGRYRLGSNVVWSLWVAVLDTFFKILACVSALFEWCCSGDVYPRFTPVAVQCCYLDRQRKFQSISSLLDC